MLKQLLLLVALSPAAALAATGHVQLDKAPIDNNDTASLQRGARHFVNYCLNCHSAQYMRYNRLTDIGLTEQQIKDNLMFVGEKIGDTMKVAMNSADAAQWFGAPPPDLSVIARSRGADWLYTYLRTYYRDDTRATGWNNLAFPNVGMPHVLWELQGQQVLKVPAHAEGAEAAHGHAAPKLVLATAGTLSPKEYDAFVADLVNYLVFMGEPARSSRTQLGILVLLFLGAMFVFAYALKKEYWKDVH
jgi:ubiquinol-cytochrome c reductase cytochrome c1 subunit